MEENIELKIRALIDKIRPFLINDGGNIEFIKNEDNIDKIIISGNKTLRQLTILIRNNKEIENYVKSKNIKY